MSMSTHRLQDAPVPTDDSPIPENAPLALLGQSPAIGQIRQHLRRIGPYFRRALLTGEPGSGKEATARFLHSLTPASAGPFIVAGAAAVAQNGSPIDAARRGTLFLQDVGSLPLAAQDLLMRRLANLDQKVRARLVDTRLIGASNTDLKALTLTGQFRQDLYNCLSVVELRLPPLRDRADDLDALLDACLRKSPATPPTLSPEVRAILTAHSWPGNLRELEQVVAEAAASATEAGSPIIEEAHLPQLATPPETAPVSNEPATVARLDDVMRRHVIEVLSRCAGNKLKAAELLGISRSTLYRMLDGG